MKDGTSARKIIVSLAKQTATSARSATSLITWMIGLDASVIFYQRPRIPLVKFLSGIIASTLQGAECVLWMGRHQ